MGPEGILNLMSSAAGLPLIEAPPKPPRPRMDMGRDPDFPNRVAKGAKLRKTLAPFVPSPLLDMLVLGRIMGWYPDPSDPSSQMDGRDVVEGLLGGSGPLRRDIPPAPASNASVPPVSESTPKFENPGPIFDNIEASALDAHGYSDPISKKLNTEFRWDYYYDNRTGKIGYTDPVPNGVPGGRGGRGPSAPPTSNGIPIDRSTVTPLGPGHNHGDYSVMDAKGNIVRSPRPVPVQDDFSRGDPSDMKTMQEGPDNRVYTLGTPDGKVWMWTKYGGKQRLK